MHDNGQGGGTKPGNVGAGQGFDALARQYWNAWGEALRSATPGAAQAGNQPWQEAMDWWGRFAPGGGQASHDTFDRFNAQARQWFGQMQQLAAQFGGQQASASEVAAGWKRAMEAAGGNPFGDLMRGMRGPGLQGFEQWLEQARPWLDGLRSGATSWLHAPTFGFAREHQQRWQQLALAMAEYQQCTQAYDELMRQATRDAYTIFEDKLAEREEPGRQVQSARALFGMPTRTELDGAHRKIVELERQVRRLRDGFAGGQGMKDAAAPVRPAAKKGRAAGAPIEEGGTARKPEAKQAGAQAGAADEASRRQASARAAKRKR